jgi:general secretion pathway protein D
MKKTANRLAIILSCFVLATSVLTGCDLTKNQMHMDRSNNVDFQEYRDALAPRIEEAKDVQAAAQADDAGIPDLQSYVAQPSESLKSMPLVSVSVNQTVPLRDVFFELAKQADYDVELDPRIKGSIIFTARNKPLDEVVGKIADMANLRYKFNDDSFRVELDTPYNKNYKIDYLSYIRKNKSSVNNDVSVVSGDGADSGSKFEASSESEADFWGELEKNVAAILNIDPNALKTKKDPRITAAESNPAPVQPVAASPASGATPPADGTTPAPTVEVKPPEAVLQVQSLPTDTEDEEDNASNSNGQQSIPFSINRQAGMISVFAGERQHKEIEKYLNEVRRAVTAQVLIEAKVLEVSLTDEFASGVNWAALDLFSNKMQVGFEVTGNSAAPAFVPAVSPTVSAYAQLSGTDFEAAIEALSRFGTVKALSSPRLTVLNNQSAVLGVAANRVYFEMDIDVTQPTANTAGTVTIDSNIRNVPEGVLINVQPSIDLDRRSVSMAVRPTITRVLEYINDPGIQFVTATANPPIDGIESRVPVVNVQELDSVVKMNSGEAIIMGGLMQDRTDATQTGVPVLSEIPLLGHAFKNHGDKVSKTELVVFIKATIIDDGNTTIQEADKDLYNKFSGDRRPTKM